MIPKASFIWSALALALPAAAQLPFPELSSIFPPGAQAGQTVEVTIGGSELDDCRELAFSHPGLRSEPVLLPADEFHPERPAPNRFLVTVAPDAPPGIYETHAHTRLGLTAPHAFAVGSLPEAVHASNNNDPATPMPLPLGTVVNAHPDAEQIDYYLLELQRDQRVVIQCRGEPLDSRIDATLVLFDSDGQELMRDHDTLARDAVLDFTAPQDGSYELRVFDFLYRGGIEFAYRLLAGSAPHLDFVYPPAGQPGTTGKFKLYGRNLPGGSRGEGVLLDGEELESLEVEIPLAEQQHEGLVLRPVPATLTPGIEYRFEANGLRSNAIRIGFASAPIVEEIESADDQSVTPPCEIHGRFDDDGDLDRYRFEARKDTPLWIECISARLREGLDPLLVIERLTRDEQGNERAEEVASIDDAGGNPGGRRFPIQTRDPFLQFAPPEDGTYRVTILNQSSLAGPAALYRLVVREAEPDFEIIATASDAEVPDKQIPRLPTLLRRDGTALVEVAAVRKGGFDGEIALTADGLPPGVTCPPATIRRGDDSATLVLKCADDAQSWNGFINISGTAGEMVRAARAGTLAWSVGNWDQERAKTRLASRLALSVCAEEQAPVVVQGPESTRLEVELDGKLDIPLKLIKHAGTKGEFTIRPAGLPFRKDPPQAKLKPEDHEGTLTIEFKKTNEFPIEPGEWQFALRCEGTVIFRNNPAAADHAEEERKRLEALEQQLQESAGQARAAVDPLRQTVQEAERNVQSASPEAKGELEAKLDEARTAFQTAEEQARQADELAKRAAEEKNRAAERARQATERAKERDVKFAAYSLPLTVVVKPAAPTEESK